MSVLKIIKNAKKQDWEKSGYGYNLRSAILKYDKLPGFLFKDSGLITTFKAFCVEQAFDQLVIKNEIVLSNSLLSQDGDIIYLKEQTNNYLKKGTYYYQIVTGNFIWKSEPFIVTEFEEIPITPLSISTIHTDESGDNSNDGTITITGVNGLPPYTYSIGGLFQTSNVFQNLSPGNYTAVVKDSQNTEASEAVVIDEFIQPLLLSLGSKTDESSAGANDGEINLLASGGVLPYEYSKDNGLNYQASSQFTGLAPATYDCLVRDGVLNTAPLQVVIEAGQVVPSFNIANKTYQGITGEIGGTIIVTAYSPGVAPFEYSKDGGTNWQSSNIFNELVDGNYQIIARDSNLDISNTINVVMSALALGSPDINVDMSNLTWLAALSAGASYSYSAPKGTVGLNDGAICELRCNTLLSSFYGQNKKIAAILDLATVAKTGDFDAKWIIGKNAFIETFIPEDQFVTNNRVFLNFSSLLLIQEDAVYKDIRLFFDQNGGSASTIEVTGFKLWLYD